MSRKLDVAFAGWPVSEGTVDYHVPGYNLYMNYSFDYTQTLNVFIVKEIHRNTTNTQLRFTCEHDGECVLF